MKRKRSTICWACLLQSAINFNQDSYIRQIKPYRKPKLLPQNPVQTHEILHQTKGKTMASTRAHPKQRLTSSKPQKVQKWFKWYTYRDKTLGNRWKLRRSMEGSQKTLSSLFQQFPGVTRLSLWASIPPAWSCFLPAETLLLFFGSFSFSFLSSLTCFPFLVSFLSFLLLFLPLTPLADWSFPHSPIFVFLSFSLSNLSVLSIP